MSSNYPKYPTFVAALTGSDTLEEEAVSSLNTPYDAFALAVHVWATARARLAPLAVHDDDCVPAPAAEPDTAPVTAAAAAAAAAASAAASGNPRVQLNQTRWSKSGPHYYAFKYAAAAAPSGADKTATLDVTVTKLGQRDVQVSVTGAVARHPNSANSEHDCKLNCANSNTEEAYVDVGRAGDTWSASSDGGGEWILVAPPMLSTDSDSDGDWVDALSCFSQSNQHKQQHDKSATATATKKSAHARDASPGTTTTACVPGFGRVSRTRDGVNVRFGGKGGLSGSLRKSKDGKGYKLRFDGDANWNCSSEGSGDSDGKSSSGGDSDGDGDGNGGDSDGDSDGDKNGDNDSDDDSGNGSDNNSNGNDGGNKKTKHTSGSNKKRSKLTDNPGDNGNKSPGDDDKNTDSDPDQDSSSDSDPQDPPINPIEPPKDPADPPINPIEPPKNPTDPPNYQNPTYPAPKIPKHGGAGFGGGLGGGGGKNADGSFGGGLGGGGGGGITFPKHSKCGGGNKPPSGAARQETPSPPSIQNSGPQSHAIVNYNNQVYNIHHHYYYYDKALHEHHEDIPSLVNHTSPQESRPTDDPRSTPPTAHDEKETCTEKISARYRRRRRRQRNGSSCSSELNKTSGEITNMKALSLVADKSPASSSPLQEDEEFSAVSRFVLAQTVDTAFFVHQPRESEDMCDVYVSRDALAALWNRLDQLVLGRLAALLSEPAAAAAEAAPAASPAAGQEETKKDARKEDDRPTQDEEEATKPSRPRPVVSEAPAAAAAESSPSPAAQGPGTPFSPYGTPPPFAARPLHRKALQSDVAGTNSFDPGSQLYKDAALEDREGEDEDGRDPALRRVEAVVAPTGSAASRRPPAETASMPPLLPQRDPLRETTPPARRFPTGTDAPPGFDDDYEILGSLAAGPVAGPGLGGGVPGGGYGARDLYPPGMAPGANPFGGLGGLGGGGGMNPTYDDLQSIAGRGSGDGGFGPGTGTAGPPQPPGRMPGARWDPTGPFGGGGNGGNNGRGPFGGSNFDFI